MPVAHGWSGPIRPDGRGRKRVMSRTRRIPWPLWAIWYSHRNGSPTQYPIVPPALLPDGESAVGRIAVGRVQGIGGSVRGCQGRTGQEELSAASCSPGGVPAGRGTGRGPNALFHARRISPRNPNALNGAANNFTVRYFSPQSGTSSCRT